MTAERVFILVVAIAVGAGAVATRTWWSFAGMVVLVLRVVHEVWRQRRTRVPPPSSGAERTTNLGTRASG